ncbi:MFS transporter [soil metagenome]
MMVAYLLNFLDRQIVNIVAEPIKKDLGLADWQLGLLTGTAFAVLYSVATIPIARLSDRGNRVWILSTCLALWSFCTAICGLAAQFWQMLAARLFVGLGEAGCAAPAQSLISDITPPERRAWALGIYSLGVPFGALLGLVMGGIVAATWGWRWTFLLPGITGVVVAVLIVLTVGDPRSGRRKSVQPKRESILRLLSQLWTSRSFRYVTIGSSLSAYVGFSTQAFFASFFLRAHGAEIAFLAGPVKPIAFVGITLGLVLGLGGALGTYFGGIAADKAKSRFPGGYLLIPAASMIVLVPFMAATFLVGGALTAFVMLTITAIFKSTWFGPTYAATHSLVAPENRATATAILLLIVNLVGLGLGPLVTGAVSTLLATKLGDVEGLRWSLVSVVVPSLLSGFFYWLGSRSFDAERVS